MESNIIFFDLETTGVNVCKDRIVQISVIKTNPEFCILEKKKYLVNPTIPIPKEASDVHGITDSDVSDKPTFKQLAKGMYQYMISCDVICGFNSNRFDRILLSEEFSREKITWPTGQKFIDCYQIFSKREKRDLASALRFYSGKEIEGAHDAENDVLATIDVLEGQLFRYELTLEDIIKESSNENEVDMDGKIILIDGVACFNIGDSKGKPVTSDVKFAMWMLGKDFSSNTKNVIKSILNIKHP